MLAKFQIRLNLSRSFLHPSSQFLPKPKYYILQYLHATSNQQNKFTFLREFLSPQCPSETPPRSSSARPCRPAPAPPAPAARCRPSPRSRPCWRRRRTRGSTANFNRSRQHTALLKCERSGSGSNRFDHSHFAFQRNVTSRARQQCMCLAQKRASAFFPFAK
jgi:hypothetical protein